MRGMYTDAILMAIAERPGIRAVEIADKVDCEVEAVERSISEQLESGYIRREIITAPNGRPTLAFWLKDAPAGKLPAIEQTAAPKPAAAVPAPKVTPEIEAPAAPTPQQAGQVAAPLAPEPVTELAAASAPPAVAPAARTKVDICMDFIRSQPDRTATDDDFRALMGLRKDQAPSSFLATQRKRAEIHKDGGLWRLGPRKSVDAVAAPAVPPIEVDAEFRCALWSDGELQLARGDQIAMRLSAGEVGQLRKYLAGEREAA